MRNDPLFVLGLPRSRTTLIMRLFNSDPNVLLQGEQSGAFDLIAKAHRAYCKDTPPRHAKNLSSDEVFSKLRTDTWVAATAWWDVQAMRDLFTKLLTQIGNPAGGNLRWGFKEVLFSDNVPETIFDLFPAAKIVLTTRSVSGYVSSVRGKGWAKNTVESVTNWNWRMKFIEQTAHTYPGSTRLIRFEDMDEGALKSVVEWAGVEWNQKSDAALAKVVDKAPACELSDADLDDIARFSNPTKTYG